MAKTKVLICPYCGDTQPAGERCRSCGGLFEPLSRQATHNAMGPWFIRDEARPYQPGCSYETLVKLLERGQVNKNTIIRGPTTKQFWTVARRVPGVAHLLGFCHSCDASVDVGDHGCHACGVPFGAYLDRNFMGLPEIRPLPWEAPLEEAQQEPASSRMMEFRRAAEPLGISSFASDDELRGSGLNPMQPYARRAIASSSMETGMATASLGAGAGYGADPVTVGLAPPSDSSLSQLAASAAQRRVRQQRRTIRLLIVALVVLGGAFAMFLYVVNNEGGNDSNAISGPGAAGPVGGRDSSGELDAAARSAPEAGDATEKNQSEAGEPTPATVPTRAGIDVEAEYARAQELIASGALANRPLPDRIRDYEAALAALQRISADAPPDVKPPGLADEIERVQKSLDDLRLKAFFP